MTRSKYIYKKISYTARVELQALLDEGISAHAIQARELMHRSSVAREIKRCKGKYNADEAQLDFDNKANLKKTSSIENRFELTRKIESLEKRVAALEKKKIE